MDRIAASSNNVWTNTRDYSEMLELFVFLKAFSKYSLIAQTQSVTNLMCLLFLNGQWNCMIFAYAIKAIYWSLDISTCSALVKSNIFTFRVCKWEKLRGARYWMMDRWTDHIRVSMNAIVWTLSTKADVWLNKLNLLLTELSAYFDELLIVFC